MLKLAGICLITGRNGNKQDIGNYYRSTDANDNKTYLLLSKENAVKYHNHPELKGITIITRKV